MEKTKETAANVGASAKSGMEKTKANVQEKTERLTTRDPLEKELATQKKEERVAQAELDKQAARNHNAAATAGNTVGQGQHHTTGTGGNPNATGYGTGGTHR
uniref:Seed albumin protein of a late embryogenesis abundant group 1 n=4 Tax=Pisum sativum TaxID=3888 RepID=A0A8J9TY35_PEA|nr:seed albumin protein of a late embryogenesis abundant group 1 [Pisum sativum subsp. elatius]CAH0117522.1 seed albumin protein of a late embryogenesis abundant group 1 [Pisum sativum subsp. elatius]CAH0117524.1 seed albumin protein of a late embryogenesis abundant group 1 [Pisum abyssinicum]CAH0117526.1 seed albumin protein of a late embryogenesis abundant group 1 [Pisum sativum]CAH0117528.1 seed albumin protein of a late embryogenesis abundant group 1 [Pisum sativum subsp. sativum]